LNEKRRLSFGGNLQIPIALLVFSFTGFYAAMNIQSHKHTVRADLVGITAYEVSTLCPFLAVANVVMANPSLGPARFPVVVALLFWFVDHGIRYSSD
jgi:hypothetical protein